MSKVLPAAIGIFAVAGLGISIYLTLVKFGILESHLQSEICDIGNAECGDVLRSPQANILGIPNTLVGIGYYTLMGAAAVFRLLAGRWPVPWLLLAAVGAGVVASIYLLYTLLYVLRQPCPYCIVAHMINGSIAAMYLISLNS